MTRSLKSFSMTVDITSAFTILRFCLKIRVALIFEFKPQNYIKIIFKMGLE